MSKSKSDKRDNHKSKKSALWAGVVLGGYGNRQGAMKSKKAYNRKVSKRELHEVI
jgi:hypothetical protein